MTNSEIRALLAQASERTAKLARQLSAEARQDAAKTIEALDRRLKSEKRKR